jgi:hypothetical protein
MTVTASGAMTAARAVPGATAARAVTRPRTATVSRPLVLRAGLPPTVLRLAPATHNGRRRLLAVRAASHGRPTTGARAGMQAGLEAGDTAPLTKTALTGRAG